MDQDLIRLLPPGTITFEPLEYSWEEAKVAYIFTSKFDGANFKDWAASFASYTQLAAPNDAVIHHFDYPKTATLEINICANEKIDLHAAWCRNPIGFENLNAWLGSALLKSLVEEQNPATAGVIRVENSSVFMPDELRNDD